MDYLLFTDNKINKYLTIWPFVTTQHLILLVRCSCGFATQRSCGFAIRTHRI